MKEWYRLIFWKILNVPLVTYDMACQLTAQYPKNPTYWVQRGVSETWNELPEAAINSLSHAHVIEPRAEALIVLSMLWATAGKTALAADAAQQALLWRPEAAGCFAYVATILAEQQEYQVACDIIRMVVSLGYQNKILERDYVRLLGILGEAHEALQILRQTKDDRR